MLNERQVKHIEQKLTDFAVEFEDSRNREFKERCRGYCQGVAFMLAEIGYAVEWDNGKATVVKED